MQPKEICVVSLDTYFNYRPIPLKEVEGYFDPPIDTFLYATEREEFEKHRDRYRVVFLSMFHFDVELVNRFCQEYNGAFEIVCGGYFFNKYPDIAFKVHCDGVGFGDLLTVLQDYIDKGTSEFVYSPSDLQDNQMIPKMSPFVPMNKRRISYRKDFFVNSSHHTMLYTSRGSCPATCTFCARYAELLKFKQFGDFENYKSAAQIITEIKDMEAIGLHPAVKIAIGDSDFIGNESLRNRALELVSLIREPPKHRMVIWTSADSLLRMEPEFLKLLFQKLNVAECRIGIENFSDVTLTTVSRGFKSLKKNLDVYRLGNEFDFPFKFSFIFFTPFTRPTDIIENLKQIGNPEFTHSRLSPIEAWTYIDQVAFLYRDTPMYQQFIHHPNMTFQKDSCGNIVSWEFANKRTEYFFQFIKSVKRVLRDPSYAMCAIINRHNELHPGDRKTIRGDGLVNGYAKTLPGCLTCAKRQHGGRKFVYRLVSTVRSALIDMLYDLNPSETGEKHLQLIRQMVLNEFSTISNTIGLQPSYFIGKELSPSLVKVSDEETDNIEIDYGKGRIETIPGISFAKHT